MTKLGSKIGIAMKASRPWDLSGGFQLEDPHLFVPWGITTDGLVTLVERDHSKRLKRVTDDYYTLPCTILRGLRVNLGFHFRGGKTLLGLRLQPSRLLELEVFRDAYPDLQVSYRDFQDHLEQLFGKPTTVKAGDFDAAMPTAVWQLGMVQVHHYVFDRYGPEEHVHFLRKGRLPERALQSTVDESQRNAVR